MIKVVEQSKNDKIRPDYRFAPSRHYRAIFVPFSQPFLSFHISAQFEKWSNFVAPTFTSADSRVEHSNPEFRIIESWISNVESWMSIPESCIWDILDNPG